MKGIDCILNTLSTEYTQQAFIKSQNLAKTVCEYYDSLKFVGTLSCQSLLRMIR